MYTPLCVCGCVCVCSCMCVCMYAYSQQEVTFPHPAFAVLVHALYFYLSLCVLCVCVRACVRVCTQQVAAYSPCCCKTLLCIALMRIYVCLHHIHFCASTSHTYDRWLPSPTTEGAGRSGTAISGTRYATLSKAWTVLPEPLLLSCVGHPTSTPTQTQAKQNGGYLVCVRVRVRALCVAYPTSSGKNGV
jgi:hypothetical protein